MDEQLKTDLDLIDCRTHRESEYTRAERLTADNKTLVTENHLLNMANKDLKDTVKWMVERMKDAGLVPRN